MAVRAAARRGAPGRRDRFRRRPLVGGEGQQQRLVGEQIVEHRGEKAGIGGGGAQIFRAEAGKREKARQPIGLGGEKAERGDRELLAVSRKATLTASQHRDSSFVNVSRLV